MARRPTGLADLDIEGEARAQQDGLAERLSRRRAQSAPAPVPEAPPAPVPPTAPNADVPTREAPRVSTRERNKWRAGRTMVQFAVPEDEHIELSLIATRRRMTLSQLSREAINAWLEAHGHTFRISG